MNVYADNGATTQVSQNAIDAMLPYLTSCYGNPSSIHTKGWDAAKGLREARSSIAHNLGCNADEIIFTSGGTEADNQAIVSAAAIGKANGKKHIISTQIEHHAVLHTLDKLKHDYNFDITLLPVDKDGFVTAEQVSSAIRNDTCLVTVMYANNEIGTVEPIREIGKVCREKGVLFHTDAVQAAGHIKIDVEKDNIDMMSVSAHKFHGMKGVGALYCRNGIKLEKLLEGGGQEGGNRAGTENVPAIVCMAAALDEACTNMNENTKRVREMQDRLIDGLLKIPHSALNGSRQNRLVGNVNMRFDGVEGETLALLLDAKGICVSAGSACTAGSIDPSHVITALGLSERDAREAVRITLSEYNTDEEVDCIIDCITEAVEQLRSDFPRAI